MKWEACRPGYQSRKLIEQIIGHLSALSAQLLIVISNRQSKSSFSSYAEAKKVVDLYPGKGSLGGVYTGLVYSSCPYNLVVACDMPFLNLALLRYMVDVSPGFDAVIPRIDGLNEALHAVYTKNCLHTTGGMLRKAISRSKTYSTY